MRLTAMLAVLVACGRPAAAPAPAPTPRSAHVDSPLMRKMRGHGAELMAMRAALYSGSYARVEQAADALAQAPLTAAPATQILHDQLPSSFFDLQAQMIAAARDVSKAARVGDDAALTVACDALAETCQSCHTVYRALEARRP